MKGLSTILAMILIVIIVVALIGLTYTFAANLFQTTTTTATSSVETTTQNMDKHVSVRGTVTCKNTTATALIWRVSLTLRHDGSTYNINTRANELTAIVDTVSAMTYNAPKLNETTIAPQTTITTNFEFTNTSAMTSGSHTLYIESPAGEISESLTCTYV
ncbi:hypothetical protein A3K64_02625 [Candidatus Micrarchaeota archaeon RBG_16_36_9]|nr:MAG: hypothetical protein A3K64_02625 [Candidatus Micrarchaeota archaeon RBG_16_36_9]